MARCKVPPDVKKRQITVSLDPDIFEVATATPNASAWVNELCRRRVDAEKETKKKGKK